MEALFTSQARIAILELFLLRSSSRHYLREVAALTDQPVRAVQREVARLEEAGILRSESEGNRKYFAANRDSPVFPELRALFLKAAGFAQVLQSELHEGAGSIRVALIFGSFAAGEEMPQSDIDILIIGSLTSRQLSRLLKPAKQTLRREVNPVLMTEGEIRDKVAGDDPFVRTILREPKLFLKGDSHELEELASIGAA